MLAQFKSLLATLCLLSTVVLYHLDPSRNLVPAVAIVQDFTPESAAPSSYEDGIAAPDLSNSTRLPRILQATMMFGHNYKGMNERPLQSHAEHAKGWGYGNHVLTREIVGAGEVEGEGEWNKFILLEKPREERAEWVVWYDADTMILNPTIQWETFLPPTDNELFADIKVLATKDNSGFNAGVFFCRVDEWVVDTLTDAYALPRLSPEVNITGNIEQNAMKWLFSKVDNKRHVVYQPDLWYNGFSTAHRPDDDVKGDMMIHFSGINHDDENQLKRAIMEAWFSKMTDPASWSLPLEKTRYHNEVPAFWQLLGVARKMLSLVEDRGDTGTVENEITIQIARNELRWTAEEEAFDFEKMNKSIHDLVDALSVSERLDERALLQVFGKDVEEADEMLARGGLSVYRQPVPQEAVPMPEVPRGKNQYVVADAGQRFDGSEDGSVKYG